MNKSIDKRRFEEWWEGYSKEEYFNEPLDTLRHTDHDDPNFDNLIKGVAEMAFKAGAGEPASNFSSEKPIDNIEARVIKAESLVGKVPVSEILKMLGYEDPEKLRALRQAEDRTIREDGV